MKNNGLLRIESFNSLYLSSPLSSSSYGAKISPNMGGNASIAYYKLPLLRMCFEDNISTTDKIEIVNNDGKSVFWGSLDELIEILTSH